MTVTVKQDNKPETDSRSTKQKTGTMIYEKKMDSWLLEVQRMKIPRPKFSGKYPLEPPKDYSVEDSSKDEKRTAAALLTARNIVRATEDLRREIQEKL